MHVDDTPYEILRRPHGRGGFDTVTWAPTLDVRVLPATEWAPWMAALGANA